MATLTRRSIAMSMIGLLALVLGLSMLVPAAHAAESESGVTFLDEGWWLRFREPLEPVPPAGSINENLPNDSTEIPRATLRDQTNPYKGEYTRVSTFPTGEGDEAVAAYSFDLFSLGGGAAEAQITGGTVTFVAAPAESAPQEGDGANGQRNEEGAAMIACVVTDFFAPDFAGNWEERPKVDEEACAPLEPTDPVNERPAWTLDLGAFASAWSEGNFGFSVIPDPEAEAEGALFHVAFPTNLNNTIDTEKFPPPTADVTFEVEELDLPSFDTPGGGEDFPSFDAPAESSGDFSSGSGGSTGGFDSGAGSSGGGFDSGSSGSSGSFGGGDAPLAAEGDIVQAEEPETAAVEESLAGDEAATTGIEEPVAAAAEEEGGINLGYLLVPLLGLGLAGTLGYSLSKDPELALEREGAVSKLMQRRQAQGALGAGDR